MPTGTDPKQELIAQISEIITAFNLNSAELIKDAQLPLPGDTSSSAYDRVMALFQEKQMLEDAQWEITNRELSKNNALYQSLMTEAKQAAADAKDAINTLKSYADTMTNAAKVIDLIGRLLIKLAI